MSLKNTLNWEIRISDTAKKELKRLEKQIQLRILEYITQRLEKSPYDYGKPLRGKFKGLRRYRVGDYRIICFIDDRSLSILLLTIGHRKNVYRLPIGG
jgi:mRNA interferase RelE/StbE